MNPQRTCVECFHGVMMLSDDGESSTCDRCGFSQVEPPKAVGIAGLEAARKALDLAVKPGVRGLGSGANIGSAGRSSQAPAVAPSPLAEDETDAE